MEVIRGSEVIIKLGDPPTPLHQTLSPFRTSCITAADVLTKMESIESTAPVYSLDIGLKEARWTLGVESAE